MDTDEDLAQLKKDLPLLRHITVGLTTGSRIERLVKRLETAERCASYLDSLAVLDMTTKVLLKEGHEAIRG